jgi:hypothetical protein
MSNDHEKYNRLMMELYKANQIFLDKVILNVSMLALPFIFNALLSNGAKAIFFSVSLGISSVGFLFAIILHILSSKTVRDGCDKSMEQTDEAIEEGARLFNRAKRCDSWRDNIFLFSFVIMVAAIVVVSFADIIRGRNYGIKLW